MVLNVPKYIYKPDILIPVYEKYRMDFDLEFITTFLSCARKIKELDSSQKIVCSYNQGIKTYKELNLILESNLFDAIVLGNHFIRDFDAFRLVHKYGHKVELLLNNGCMPNCDSFCRFPNSYCINNFEENLSKKNVNYLYAECSLFPEELHKFFIPMELVDYYKLSTRPIYYGGMDDMLSSYIKGDSSEYINKSVTNYNLYGRLAHFHKYYNIFQYTQIMCEKKNIWEQLRETGNPIAIV